jgi:hypothetical protein
MQQIKFFKGLEADIGSLEREVNDWLRNDGVRVIQVFGNIAPQSRRNDPATTPLNQPRQSSRAFDSSDIFLAVLYEIT